MGNKLNRLKYVKISFFSIPTQSYILCSLSFANGGWITSLWLCFLSVKWKGCSIIVKAIARWLTTRNKGNIILLSIKLHTIFLVFARVAYFSNAQVLWYLSDEVRAIFLSLLKIPGLFQAKISFFSNHVFEGSFIINVEQTLKKLYFFALWIDCVVLGLQ